MLLRLLRVIVSGIVLLLAIPGFSQQNFCDLDDLLECTRLSAQKLTRDFPQAFSLKQDKLQLRFKDKSSELMLLSATSMEEHPDDLLSYPIHFWADKNWLLVKQFTDAGETQIFAIIDLAKDFKKVELNGTPVFSPDGKKLLTYGADIYAGYSANGIAIYDIAGDNQLKEVKMIDENWGVLSAVWNNDQEIQLSTVEWCENDPARNENGECIKEKKLAFINNQWQLI